MNPAPTSACPAPTVPTGLWAKRYEALRDQAAGSGPSAGWGLALAVGRGLTAWMRAWPQGPPDPQRPPTPLAAVAPPADPLPSELRGQIALVLADMILTHRQEVQA